jgi:3-oxoacyl-[acyl-carrier-protein] synthase II
MAEGGAVLVLESEAHALARGAKVLAELAGYGISADAHHLTAPDPAGRQALRAMRLALNNAGASPDDVVHINAHGTSTRLNDAVEARIIRELLGIRTEAVPVSATKSVTGHMGGATGALEALFCVQSCLTGLAPPTLNYEEPDPDCLLDVVRGTARSLPAGLVLSNSFGFGGHCSCLAFRPFPGR